MMGGLLQDSLEAGQTAMSGLEASAEAAANQDVLGIRKDAAARAASMNLAKSIFQKPSGGTNSNSRILGTVIRNSMHGLLHSLAGSGSSGDQANSPGGSQNGGNQ
jgi:hypothetical protein